MIVETFVNQKLINIKLITIYAKKCKSLTITLSAERNKVLQAL